jgi:hypothetical protein
MSLDAMLKVTFKFIMASVVWLSVILLTVVRPNVVILTVVLLTVISSEWCFQILAAECHCVIILFMVSVTIKSLIPRVVMLSVVMLSVVEPTC